MYQNLYEFADDDGLEKVAGTKLPDDYKQWRSEVIKALISQHPYAKEMDTKIKFENVDPEDKRAWGYIIVENKAAILFTIRPNDDTGNIELDPLDVLFHDGKFKYLSEDALTDAVEEQQAGRVFPRDEREEEYANAPPENRYMGDQTGDVTPLEYSGYPGAHGGSRGMTMASCGAVSRVVRDDRDINRLFNLLSNYSGIDAAAEAVGLHDSLENLRSGIDDIDLDQKFVHIIQRPDGQLMVVYHDGETRSVSATDLKQMLGEAQFKDTMREVLGQGWSMIRDFPTVESVEAPAINTLPAPIENGGWCRLMTPEGDKKEGVVATQMVNFEGDTIRKQKAVCSDGDYCTGKALLGVRMEEDVDAHPMVGSELAAGNTGCFLDESFSPTMTPNIKIDHIAMMPGEPTIIEATRPDTGERIGLVMAENLVKPQRIQTQLRGSLPDDLPDTSFYIPEHMKWLELEPGEIQLADKGKRNSVQEVDDRAEAKLFKNASRYSLVGETEMGRELNERNLTDVEMRTKLAALGADDHALKKASGMESGEMELYGLRTTQGLKVASDSDPIEAVDDDVVTRQLHRLKEAAEEAMEGANATLNQSQEEGKQQMADPETLDSILSLQFVSEKTLSELVQSMPLFREVEDRLAKMLMAARQGEESIYEKGIQKALEGIGQAKNSLKTLSIELDSRDPHS